MNIQNLNPTLIWKYFYEINQIPRASKKEEKIRNYLIPFAVNNKIDYKVDSVGNVFLYKNASKGKENNEIVILQAHMDMVHQKNDETNFDFENQGINMYVDDDWVKAKGTTLGADNGIGLAAILAVFTTEDLIHPPLEALITMDEETGMTGAKFLKKDFLKGITLLNLDSEDEEEFSIGCAGGMDTNSFKKYSTIPIDSNLITYEFLLTGLKGGHSGMDIHLGRGNANKLLNRALYEILINVDANIVSFNGGSLRNAIPREAKMVLAFNKDIENKILDIWNKVTYSITEEYKNIDSNISFLINKIDCKKDILNSKDSIDFSKCIHSVFNGVYRMSPDINGLVEASSNLALINLNEGEFKTQSLQRSSVYSSMQDVCRTIKSTFDSFSCNVEQGNDYPGWKPNPNSEIVKKMKEWYEQMYKKSPKVTACHAGLECGILSAHFPEMDMISFGPNIKGAHSPDEKVQISSVQNFWKFLTTVLEKL